MTATEELRRLLDECGVEYFESPNGIAWGKQAILLHGRMYRHYAVELDGLLCVSSYCITPEQAVAATLGPGTCKLSRGTSGLMHVTTGHCSECGAEVVKGTKDGYRSRYCQWCGAKVVE